MARNYTVVPLATTQAYAIGKHGQQHRATLASSVTFRLAKRLKLRRKYTDVEVEPNFDNATNTDACAVAYYAPWQ